MLKTTLIGFLGRDAEVKDVNGQKAISFSVAHTESYTARNGEKKETTTWVNCTLWRQPDKARIAEYLTKGSRVYVEGMPSARAYTTKAGETVAALDLRVLTLELLGGKERGPEPQRTEKQPQDWADTSDNLPF